MKNSDQQIWAYIHNELSPANRLQFEQELHVNPELKNALEERQETDLLLKKSISFSANHQAVANELLAEWETEYPEFNKRVPTTHNKIIAFSLPLATAAAVLFLLMLQPWNTGMINWQKTAYGSAPQLRDQSTSATFYSRSTLKNISSQLQSSIESDLSPKMDDHSHWKLKIHLQELANGALLIEVSGYPKNNRDHSTIWNMSSSSLEQFESELPEFSKRIAEEITHR